MGFSLLVIRPAPAKSCPRKVNEILRGGRTYTESRRRARAARAVSDCVTASRETKAARRGFAIGCWNVGAGMVGRILPGGRRTGARRLAVPNRVPKYDKQRQRICPSVSASKISVPGSDGGDRFEDWVVGHQFVPDYLHHPVFAKPQVSDTTPDRAFLRGFPGQKPSAGWSSLG
jgi:hypothetical protein